MSRPSTMNCLLVERTAAGEISFEQTEVSLPQLRPGEVLIEVLLSSLNYKDALAATGHPGIVKSFPHVPGIDAVGVVRESGENSFPVGTRVIATGHELGVERWGGWGTLLLAPADWLVPLPAELSPLDCMTWGTAGFTAAQSVRALLKHGCLPENGPILVSGATGGVGSLTVALLARLGFTVVAVTGKADKYDWLMQLGAHEIRDRSLLSNEPQRPLLKGEYQAGVDTVGGETLATMLKRIRHRGCVACCGVAGGADLPTTVYPFILRGLALYGIDSAWCPDDIRREIWQQLAGDWRLPLLEQTRVDLQLPDLLQAVPEILAGRFAGRGVVHIGSENALR